MDKLRDFKTRFTISSPTPTTPEVDDDDDTSLIQLIDGNGNFNVKGLDEFSKMVNLGGCGLDYAVVSIIGPQSSGKSTLVNHLFGTTFKEMDAYTGRSQTTKGIWLSKAVDIKPCTIVIDVEGSDGMERGEDGVLFEKQSALFALAVSDVVLVNMWCHEVGRENGGGRALLKIVFEKILSLTSPRKMTLLFVLRDETTTPLDSLEKTLMASIQEIYNSVPKQKAYASAPLDLFFNVQVISLPNYQYEAEEFKQQVGMLKEIFIDSTDASTGLIGDQEDKVPSSEISFSLRKIWKTIKENKDLDLPAHKVMVATVRCDEIIKGSLSQFAANQDWRRLERSLKSGPVLEFGKTINSIISTTLAEFDGKAAYFDEGVRNFKRQTLLDKVLQLVQHASDSMLEHLYTKAVKAYKENFDKADRTSDQLAVAVQNCTTDSLSIFQKGTMDMENEYITWDTAKAFDRVQRDIVTYTTLTQLQASLAEAKVAREEAFAMAATARADAEKALADAKSAADILAAAKDTAAKSAADSEAAAKAQAVALKAAAQQAAAEIRAAAAERASVAAQEAAARAEEEAIQKRNSLMGWIKSMIQGGYGNVLGLFGYNG
ncbi:hypothetical protein ACHQM5_021572 [Ranunculus cassubicifolius]